MSMKSVTRDVLKWVQSLDLTYSIKNTKRDLANGFLLAEMLSKYYPLEFPMHAYDTGMGPAAKRNNWELLQKACAKIGIILSKQLVDDVMRSKAEAGAVALGIVHHHVMKSGSGPLAIIQPNATNPQNPAKIKQVTTAKPKTSKSEAMYQYEPVDIPERTPEHQMFRVKKDGRIHVTNSNAALLLGLDEVAACTESKKSDLPGGSSIFDENFGKFDKLGDDDIDKLPAILTSKRADYQAVIQHSPPSDIHFLFEVLLPCIVNFPPDTKVLYVTVNLCVYFLDLIQTVQSPSDTFQKFVSFKEAAALLSCVISSPEKITSVAKILSTFVSHAAIPDADRMHVLLYVKNSIQLAQRGSASGAAVATSGSLVNLLPVCDTVNVFIQLLCAVNFERLQGSSAQSSLQAELNCSNDEKLLDIPRSSQYTTLILSECLTVLNSHRRAAEQGVLLASPSAAVDVCAALHLLSSLASEPIQGDESSAGSAENPSGMGDIGLLPEGVATDICSDDAAFLRLARNRSSPACLQKAYGAFVAAILGNIDDSHALADAASCAAAHILNDASDDALRTCLILLAPTLRAHQKLCTAYAQALSKLDHHIRSTLLGIPSLDAMKTWNGSSLFRLALEVGAKYSRRKGQEGLPIFWNVPFLQKQIYGRPMDSWNPFGILMGVIRTIKNLKLDILKLEYLEIVLSCIVQIIANPPAHSPGCQENWVYMFSELSPFIFVSLFERETCDFGINILECFLRGTASNQASQICQQLDNITAAMLYLHATTGEDLTQREKVMQYVEYRTDRMRRGDTAYLFDDIAWKGGDEDTIPEESAAVHAAFADVLARSERAFRTAFPTLSTGCWSGE
ncbi:spermatogenesis-associated protein 4 [Entophlyctis luteolus]|nr:spermatogenesis-associated protein 4 [Entophlyctis luteolus]